MNIAARTQIARVEQARDLDERKSVDSATQFGIGVSKRKRELRFKKIGGVFAELEVVGRPV